MSNRKIKISLFVIPNGSFINDVTAIGEGVNDFVTAVFNPFTKMLDNGFKIKPKLYCLWAIPQVFFLTECSLLLILMCLVVQAESKKIYENALIE